MEGERKTPDSMKSISVGFILITLVVSLIFLRSHIENQKQEKPSLEAQDKKSSDIPNGCKAISAESLSKELSGQNTSLIIDIRNSENFQKEHLVDSQNIPLGNLPDNLLSLAKDKSYTLIGIDSNQEKLACKFLSDKGFKKIQYLEGGFANWERNFKPTVSEGNPYAFTDQSKITYINSDKLHNLIKQKTNFLFIVDVRNEASFIREHLKDAVNIPLDKLEKKRHEIPLGKRVVVYDDNGLLAFKAGVKLFDLGIMNVYTLSDGFDTWKQKGYETAYESGAEKPQQ